MQSQSSARGGEGHQEEEGEARSGGETKRGRRAVQAERERGKSTPLPHLFPSSSFAVLHPISRHPHPVQAKPRPYVCGSARSGAQPGACAMTAEQQQDARPWRSALVRCPLPPMAHLLLPLHPPHHCLLHASPPSNRQSPHSIPHNPPYHLHLPTRPRDHADLVTIQVITMPRPPAFILVQGGCWDWRDLYACLCWACVCVRARACVLHAHRCMCMHLSGK